MSEQNTMTKAWEYYELGRSYNNSLVPNQYRLVNSNIEFFIGNQWIHLNETPAMAKLPRPTFNIIKRVVSLFVASLTSSAVTLNVSPLAYYDGENLDDPETNAATFANAEIRNLLEKFKMEYRVRDALFDGAQTGDYCAHFYFNPDALPYGGAFGSERGEIEMELVDGINVMFGNPNTPDVESQPYILVIGRDTVEHLKAEAEAFKRNKSRMGKGGKYPDKLDIEEGPQPDADWQWQAAVGGRTELAWSDDKNGKALYVYLYTKVTTNEKVLDEKGLPVQETVLGADGEPVQEKSEDGKPVIGPDGSPVYKTRDMTHPVTTVHVTKSTKGFNVFEDVDTGLTRYPIAWGNWERQKNQYHGRALVTGIIPNQIFINTMFAMVMRHLQLQAFPKTVFNADLISQWKNEIGQAIGVHGLQPNQRVGDVAMNLQPADMSNQIIQAIDKAMAYTKDCLGATDAQLGNVKPDNTSALMVLQSSAEVPLENVRSNLYSFMEDVGSILLDMMGTYYGKRHVVRDKEMEEPVMNSAGQPLLDPMTGTMMTKRVTRRIIDEFDFSKFKHLWLNVGIDAGATTYYSEIATVQTLDNLRHDGTLEIIDYLERIPDKLVPRKQELIESIKERTMQAQVNQPGTTPAANTVPMGGGTPPQAPRQAPGQEGGMPTMGSPLDSAKAVASMPTAIQGKFNRLPREAKDALTTKAAL